MRVTILLIMILGASTAYTGARTLSDAEMLADTLTACIDSLTAMDEFPEAGAVMVRYATPAHWSGFASRTVESAITFQGFTIADSLNRAEWWLSLESEEFRVILQGDGKSWKRTAMTAFHYTVMDSTGTIFNAGHIARTANDVISGMQDEYDDVSRFGPAARRSVLRHESGRLRVASFLLFTGTIIWLAFK